MKVKATKTGYYDLLRRREGDVFDIDEKGFSSRWMDSLEPKQEPVSKSKTTKTKDASFAAPKEDWQA